MAKVFSKRVCQSKSMAEECESQRVWRNGAKDIQKTAAAACRRMKQNHAAQELRCDKERTKRQQKIRSNRFQPESQPQDVARAEQQNIEGDT